MKKNVHFKHNIPDVIKSNERYPQIWAEVSSAKVQMAISFLQRVIEDRTPQGAGPINMKTRYYGKVASYGYKTTGHIGTPVHYFWPVEYGAKPHPVSKKGFERIQRWVNVKLGISDIKESRRITMGIIRRIGDVGVEPQYFAKYAVEENLYYVIEILNQIPDEIIKQLS